MTAPPTGPSGSNRFRATLEAAFGIRWTPQREQDVIALGSLDNGSSDATEILNGETHFFRFPFYLEVLSAHLARAQDGSKPYRVHSAACSTGEEAYSAAFSLMGERGARLPNLDISGSDARRSAIDIASRGAYGKWSLRGVPPASQASFLTFEADRYWVREPYRSKVRFFVKNLLEPYVEKYDAVFLCNATLYMTGEAAQKAYRLVAAALRPNGLLFVAPTDPEPAIPELQRLLAYGGWPIFGPAEGAAAKNLAYKGLSPRHPNPSGRIPGHRSGRPSGRISTQAASGTARIGADHEQPPMAAGPDSTAKDVVHAWATGELKAVETELRRLVFLDPENPLWRFLTGCLLWEKGSHTRARKEFDSAQSFASSLPDDGEIEGACSVGDLRRMIEYWKGGPR